MHFVLGLTLAGVPLAPGPDHSATPSLLLRGTSAFEPEDEDLDLESELDSESESTDRDASTDGDAPSEPAEDAETSTATKRAKLRTEFDRHAIGVRAGLTVIPTWIFARFVDTHTNALCRGTNVGSFASDRGLVTQDGCNFYVGAEYTYRRSRILDIVTSVGYQSLRLPDGYWLDAGEYDGTAASLAGADYTEIELGMVFFEADFIARFPVVKTRAIEFGIGGGAGLGLGILVGDVYQTNLGANPQGYTPMGGATNTCLTLADLADFTRCTPKWDVDQDADRIPPVLSVPPSANPSYFAYCTTEDCSTADLAAFGYRNEQRRVPPVVPVVNLIVSARMIVKDSVSINLQGGFNTGFYFGGSVQYYFGKHIEARKKSREEA